jgi:hypothetical protein
MKIIVNVLGGNTTSLIKNCGFDVLLPGVLLEALSHWVCRGGGEGACVCTLLSGLGSKGRGGSRLSTLRPARGRIKNEIRAVGDRLVHPT